MMAEPNDFTWLQMAATGIGGFMAAIGLAFRSAWKLHDQLTSLKIAILKDNGQVRDELLRKIDERADKIERKADAVEERVRLVERDVARYVATNDRH